jgi:Tol biopolymer transport system component
MKTTKLIPLVIAAVGLGLGVARAQTGLSGKLVYVDALTGDLRVRYLATGDDPPIPYRPGISKPHVRISPLGDDRVAVTVGGRKISGIRVFQFFRSGNTITVANEKTITTSGWANWPTWSANGEWLAYGDNAKKTRGLWTRRSDGSGSATRLIDPGGFPFPVWSPTMTPNPDGSITTQIAFVSPQGSRGNENDLWSIDVTVSAAGTISASNAARVLALDGHDADLDWQPSGRIAFNFHMGPTLGSQIHTFDPETGEVTQLRGGIEPRWSPDASRIAFRHEGDIWIMSADGTLIDENPGTPEIDPFILESGHATWGP